jgi:hypothetical protein
VAYDPLALGGRDTRMRSATPLLREVPGVDVAVVVRSRDHYDRLHAVR